jgi:hypothetical protein
MGSPRRSCKDCAFCELGWCKIYLEDISKMNPEKCVKYKEVKKSDKGTIHDSYRRRLFN